MRSDNAVPVRRSHPLLRGNRGVDTEWIEAVRAGNPRAVARAISAVERGGPGAHAVIAALFPFTGRAQIIGVTGAPGTGKSTLVNELAKYYRRRGDRVGIVAVDPTSPFTGGAILGDRLRMQDLSGDPGVFIRSMATRGSLGGLASATFDAVQVLDAAGFDLILVETVGAGQSEVDIAKNAQTTVVVDAPGLGDEIQAIKAGILEIADVLVVNKADRDGAGATVAALEMNLNLKPKSEKSWRPPVLKTVAIRGEGTGDVVDWIGKHRAYLEAEHLLKAKERARFRSELDMVLQRELMSRLLSHLDGNEMDSLVDKMASREMDVYQVANQLLHAAERSQA
ncbi:MAG: methylmalonyl Co-A mutase-associated GTPase MeaB [Chloroflexi bacterium]|nr:methylmalonyl Co-A mutase-associated GTPase MeaB [Chloroflexota bacterium]